MSAINGRSRAAKAVAWATCSAEIGARRCAHHGEQRVRPLDAGCQQHVEVRGAAQIGDADAATADLVLVRRTDAAPGGADLLLLLAGLVEELVVRHHQVGPLGDEEAAGQRDSLGGERVDLGEECLRIEHDAVAHDAPHVRMENTGRDLVQHELPIAHHDRVAGIGAALIAHDDVGLLGQHVDELALAFVAPLGADDDYAMVILVEHRTAPVGP